MKMKNEIRKTVYSAFFLAVGLTLPFLTMQIKEIGDSLLPMHLPVLLCGLICGAKYGFTVGLILPFLRSLLFGMTAIYPAAVWMSFELCTYGLVIGVVMLLLKKKSLKNIYISLVLAMIAGRIVWGISKWFLLSLGNLNSSFTLTAFVVGGFVDAIPGIILQLILVPLIATLYFKHSKN